MVGFPAGIELLNRSGPAIALRCRELLRLHAAERGIRFQRLAGALIQFPTGFLERLGDLIQLPKRGEREFEQRNRDPGSYQERGQRCEAENDDQPVSQAVHGFRSTRRKAADSSTQWSCAGRGGRLKIPIKVVMLTPGSEYGEEEGSFGSAVRTSRRAQSCRSAGRLEPRARIFSRHHDSTAFAERLAVDLWKSRNRTTENFSSHTS